MSSALIFGIVLLIAIYILWLLLIKGFLWKFILAIGGWFGIYMFLENYIPTSKTGITVFGNLLSWSVVVPTVVLLLAMAYTREE